MKKIKLNDLKKVGKELNDLLFETPQIELKVPQKHLEEQILEAAEELTEEDEISELCEEVLEALRGTQEEEIEEEEIEEEEIEEEDNDFDNLMLIEQVKITDDIDWLKESIKVEDEFKPLRKGLKMQKDLEKLRAKCVELLEKAENTPEEEPTKKSKTKKSSSLEETVIETTDLKELIELVKENKDSFPNAKKGIHLQKNIEKLRERCLSDLKDKGTVKETKKTTPVPEKKKSTKVKGELSNKAKVWMAWNKGETNVEKLLKLCDENVQEKTIKLWLSKWDKGNGLPAIAKK